MKQIIRLCSLVVLSILFQCSCSTSNKYEEEYSTVSNVSIDAIKTRKTPKLIRLFDEKQLRELLRNDDYVLIGQSDFWGSYVPWTFAIDCAKNHGASLVAVAVIDSKTVEYDSVAYVPTHSTTFHSGSVYNFNRPYGGLTNYNGTSTTFSSTPVPVKRQTTYLHQAGYFFVELKKEELFGITFGTQDYIPGNNDPVRVYSVLKGSRAEKKGIKENDIIKSINGKVISSPEDVLPYVKGDEKIKDVEVYHESN